MERFNALGRGAQLMLVGAVLLLIDLFLPWQDFDVGGLAEAAGIDATFSGWRGVGAILGIVTIIAIAWGVARLAAVDLPLPVSAALITVFVSALVLIFGVIKMITILGDEATIWAWIGLILSIVVGVGGWMAVQEAGGVDSMRTEVSGLGSGGAAAAAPAVGEPSAAPPPPPPPAPAEPEAAPEPPAGEPSAPEERPT
jgi:hypothetical protein